MAASSHADTAPQDASTTEGFQPSSAGGAGEGAQDLQHSERLYALAATAANMADHHDKDNNSDTDSEEDRGQPQRKKQKQHHGGEDAQSGASPQGDQQGQGLAHDYDQARRPSMGGMPPHGVQSRVTSGPYSHPPPPPPHMYDQYRRPDAYFAASDYRSAPRMSEHSYHMVRSRFPSFLPLPPV